MHSVKHWPDNVSKSNRPLTIVFITLYLPLLNRVAKKMTYGPTDNDWRDFIHSFIPSAKPFPRSILFHAYSSYHSGFSLNVTSLEKPLTSEARLGPHIILSWSALYFPFHGVICTYNNWLNICFPSLTILSVTAGVLPVFFCCCLPAPASSKVLNKYMNMWEVLQPQRQTGRVSALKTLPANITNITNILKPTLRCSRGCWQE